MNRWNSDLDDHEDEVRKEYESVKHGCWILLLFAAVAAILAYALVGGKP